MGIVRHQLAQAPGEEYEILSNPRKTFIPPPGHGFLPRDTAWHHQQHVVALVRLALQEAQLQPKDITCICYTKGASNPFINSREHPIPPHPTPCHETKQTPPTETTRCL